jgi:hypothetical protein
VAQIEAAMTPEQLDAITALSQEDLQAWAQEQGLGFGPGGMGMPMVDAVIEMLEALVNA